MGHDYTVVRQGVGDEPVVSFLEKYSDGRRVEALGG